MVKAVICYIYGGLIIAEIFSSNVWADLLADRADGLHYQSFLSASLGFYLSVFLTFLNQNWLFVDWTMVNENDLVADY